MTEIAALNLLSYSPMKTSSGSVPKASGSFTSFLRDSVRKSDLSAKASSPAKSQKPDRYLRQSLRINTALCAVPESKRTVPALSASCRSLFPEIPEQVIRVPHSLERYRPYPEIA